MTTTWREEGFRHGMYMFAFFLLSMLYVVSWSGISSYKIVGHVPGQLRESRMLPTYVLCVGSSAAAAAVAAATNRCLYFWSYLCNTTALCVCKKEGIVFMYAHMTQAAR